MIFKNTCRAFMLLQLYMNILIAGSYAQAIVRPQLLFIQPKNNNLEISKTIKELEANYGKVDVSEYTIEGYSNLKDQSQINFYKKTYQYWIRKKIEKKADAGSMTIKYTLEYKNNNAPVTISLGIFRGYDGDKDAFEEWFNKSIRRYCERLILGDPPISNIVSIGLMVDQQADIDNLPRDLYYKLLEYNFKQDDETSNFTRYYIVTIDENLTATGKAYINMEKLDISKKQVSLKMCIKDKTCKVSPKPLIPLGSQKAYERSLKEVAECFAIEIKDKFKPEN